MRRLSKSARARHIRKQRAVIKKWERLSLRNAVDERRRKKRQRKNRVRNYVPAIRYLAPNAITIDDKAYRSALLKFLWELRAHYLHHPSRTLLIDFSETTQLVAGGTLLLYAELNRLISYSSNRVKLRCTEPANNRASQVLKQIGIYQICSNQSTVMTTRDDVVLYGERWSIIVYAAPLSKGFKAAWIS